MGFFMIRPIMKGAFGKVMNGLAYYSETGKSIDVVVPNDDTLQKLTSC